MITIVLEKLYADAFTERSMQRQSHSKDKHRICDVTEKVLAYGVSLHSHPDL